MDSLDAIMENVGLIGGAKRRGRPAKAKTEDSAPKRESSNKKKKLGRPKKNGSSTKIVAKTTPKVAKKKCCIPSNYAWDLASGRIRDQTHS